VHPTALLRNLVTSCYCSSRPDRSWRTVTTLHTAVSQQKCGQCCPIHFAIKATNLLETRRATRSCRTRKRAVHVYSLAVAAAPAAADVVAAVAAAIRQFVNLWLIITIIINYYYNQKSAAYKNCSALCDRSFAVAGPRIWNSLPDGIRDPTLSPGTLLQHWWKLTYLFG